MRLARTLLILLGILVPFAWLAYVYPSLPPTLPSHFDAAGHANRIAPRSFVWWLPSIAAGLALSLTVIARYPGFFNLPAPPGSPARPLQEALAVELLAWLRLELVWTFAYVTWSTVRVATRRANGLCDAFLVVELLMILGTVATFMWRMVRSTGVQARHDQNRCTDISGY